MEAVALKVMKEEKDAEENKERDDWKHDPEGFTKLHAEAGNI